MQAQPMNLCRFFIPNRLYLKWTYIGGVAMNEFEHDVQCKRNDFTDSVVGMVVSFGFFASIFIIATLVDFIAG